MPKIKFYHIKTLLWTYLVWTVLNLLFAFWGCGIYKHPLTWMPYHWALLHITPLMFFLPKEIHAVGMVPLACTVLAALVFVAGLLINRRWGRFLIIIGMSIWFFLAFCILGMGV